MSQVKLLFWLLSFFFQPLGKDYPSYPQLTNIFEKALYLQLVTSRCFGGFVKPMLNKPERKGRQLLRSYEEVVARRLQVWTTQSLMFSWRKKSWPSLGPG